jgi:tetratricopeptide (TPR) repeat protein
MAAFLLLAAVSALAVVCRKKHPYLLVGWLWYLGMLLPVSGIMQISYYAGADRYNYLPGIGLLLAGTWAVADGSSGWKFRTVRLGVLMAAVMGILMACAWRQTSCWKNSETLWNHTLACDNNNYVAHNNLAYYLLDKGRLEEAFDHFHTAVELAPNNSDVHFGFAKVLREHGKLDEAIGQYEEAVRLTPSNSKAHNDLGTALRQKGRLDEAINQFQLAIKSDPGNESIDFNLARTFYQAGRTGDAISQYESALRLDPTDVEAQNNLAWILAAAPQVSLRDGAKAAQLAARANEQTGGKNPVILGTLAAAYAEAGRFAEAVKCAQTAIELAQSTGRSELAAKINRELQRYEEGQALPPTK